MGETHHFVHQIYTNLTKNIVQPHYHVFVILCRSIFIVPPALRAHHHLLFKEVAIPVLSQKTII